MTDKQIIDDQKKTIHRLQDECTEKTNAIIALGEQLQTKEQECEELKVELNTKKTMMDGMMKCSRYTVEQLNSIIDQLKAELKSAKELREYTYDCCKQAGEELAKNSFEWDGKEKNLVVQAMELNEKYDQLKKANDEKNELLAQLGCPTVGTARRLTLSLKQQLDQLKAENEELKKSVMLKCPQCGEVYLDPIDAKLYETLADIKEVAEKSYRTPLAEKDCIICDDFLGQILQKISECEVINDR